MSDEMSLKYRIDLEDLVAWNQYHSERSPTLRRVRVMWTWGLSLVVLVVLGLFSLLQRDVTLALAGVVWAAIYLYLAPLWRRRSARRLVESVYKEGRNRGSLGRRVLRITEDGLVESTEVSEGITRWQGVERVAETPGYAFIYISANQAFVIPEKKVEEGDFRAFVDEVARRIAGMANG